ncbi:hypothetical protein J2P12_03610 [Candidatus Bathyarchaeota archaeon]|nr:hypothetical protein [Candidatus Bathyarchaeota archaeon]
MISAEFRSGYTGGPYYLVTEGAPVTIDREEFQYAYKCGHCSHEWSEKRVEKHEEG